MILWKLIPCIETSFQNFGNNKEFRLVLFESKLSSLQSNRLENGNFFLWGWINISLNSVIFLIDVLKKYYCNYSDMKIFQFVISFFFLSILIVHDK